MLQAVRRSGVVVLVLVAVLGCAVFTSHYDATRHENFTKLKAFHVKFITDYTEGGPKEWNLEGIEGACDEGDLKFREALTYAESKDSKDGSGARAVSILKDQFEADCELLKTRGKLFSQAWAGEHLPELEANYGYAIAGELARVGASQ